jgi:hypothetical protein
MCRDYTIGFARRNSSPASRRHPWAPTRASSSPALEGRGKALYEKSSGRENLLEERLDAVPAWLAVAGKPASCT